MGTQVAIAEQIVDGDGDYILALKANQNGLFQQVMKGRRTNRYSLFHQQSVS